MKKYKNIAKVLLLMSVGVLSSCKSDYLETDPTGSVSTELATSTVDNLSYIINGMHRDMYLRQNGSQGQNGGTAILIYNEVLGDDLVFPSNGNGWFVSTLRWQDSSNASSGNLIYPYRFYYSLIKNANLIILNASNATGDPAQRDKVVGEAYAFRAYSYFMLVQLYAKRYNENAANTQLGVPIRLDDSFTPIARNTVDEVYQQINNDLASALSLLNGKVRSNKSHFNTNVVKGLMARVALVQGRYTDAATYAKEARQGFPLMSNAEYKQGFNDYTNAEWMWGYHIQADQTDYFGNWMAYMSRNYNSTQIRQAPKVMSKKLFDLFPASDVRTQVVDATGLHASLNLPGTYSKFPYTSQKFLSVPDNNTSLGDISFMRAAEMYLIEAEALAKSGKESESKQVFNQLEGNRNPSYAGAVTSGAAYITEVLNSRRIELWGEGFRFLDLKRLNQPLDRNGSNFVASVVNGVFDVPAGDKRWTWLIPKTEIDNSKGLVVQNEL